MFEALLDAEVEYIVVGAHALAVHGVPRATGDIDIFVRPTADNAANVINALEQFGAPVAAHGVTAEDFARPGTVYQLGLPPRRIDLLTAISGVSFDEAWADRVEADVGRGVVVSFLGRGALLRNKLAAGRDQDLVDARVLEAKKS